MEVHAAVAPDMDLASIAEQYDDIKQSAINKNNVKHVLKVIRTTKQDEHQFLANILARILARILVCKSHSADCERLVSAYTNLKSRSRASLKLSTISNYILISICLF